MLEDRGRECACGFCPPQRGNVLPLAEWAGPKKHLAWEAMMGDAADLQLKHLHGKLGNLVCQMSRVQFTQFSAPQGWSPALNIYRCDHCFVVCADLAGVDKTLLDLRVAPRHLLLRGRRQAPEPRENSDKPVQVLAMEIDYGVFEREVLLPMDIEPGQVTAEQENGLLWIRLPIRKPT